jgi:hypothetical protein
VRQILRLESFDDLESLHAMLHGRALFHIVEG